MSRAQASRAGIRASVVVLVMGSLVMGCAGGDSASPPIRDAGAGVDLAFPDGGSFDFGVPSDQGSDFGPLDGGPVIIPGLYPASAERWSSFASLIGGRWPIPSIGATPAWQSCFDTDASCEIAACRALASCCVGNGRCASLSVDDAVPTQTIFSGCATGVVATDCLADPRYLSFGPTPPRVESGGLRPGGDATAEGGLRVGAPPRSTPHPGPDPRPLPPRSGLRRLLGDGGGRVRGRGGRGWLGGRRCAPGAGLRQRGERGPPLGGGGGPRPLDLGRGRLVVG